MYCFFSVDWWGLDWRLDDGISDTVIESEFGQYSTRLMADRALNIIDGHSFKSVPLFLFMSFQATHAANSEDPIQVPTDTEMKYDVSFLKQRNNDFFCFAALKDLRKGFIIIVID